MLLSKRKIGRMRKAAMLKINVEQSFKTRGVLVGKVGKEIKIHHLTNII